jgi:hypothetical protein
MKAARLVRVTGTRLVPVKTNAHLPPWAATTATCTHPDRQDQLRSHPDGELGYADETKVCLADVAKVRARIGYEYDFGDGWEHDLIVEARVDAEDGKIYPACIAGEGACPPEDSGGAYGFADLKEIVAGPPTDERYEMQAWAGEDNDPGRIDLAAANAAVAAV